MIGVRRISSSMDCFALTVCWVLMRGRRAGAASDQSLRGSVHADGDLSAMVSNSEKSAGGFAFGLADGVLGTALGDGDGGDSWSSRGGVQGGMIGEG